LSEAVLDSSALPALLWNEPGADHVCAALPGALVSSVNLAEVMTKLCERGLSASEGRELVESLGVVVVDFDADQAEATTALRESTRSLGLSLGDRACLALARRRNCAALTADSAWLKASGFEVRFIRSK
jgi:PIN domain nuclease of toxin-antitoxin system